LYRPPFDLAIPVNPLVNHEHTLLLPKPQHPTDLALVSFVQLLCSSPQLLLRGLWRHICIAWVSNRCGLLLPKGQTIHAQRDLRTLGLKVLRRGLQAVAGGVLILVGLVVAGGGFGGRGGVLGYLLGETGRGFFFAWVDGHDE